MLGRNVERREVVEVGLDMRPFGHGEAHVAEDLDDLIEHLADRVHAAPACSRAGTGRVTSTVSVARRASSACVVQHLLAGRDGVRDLRLEPVERRSHDLALFRHPCRRGPSSAPRRSLSCRGPQRGPIRAPASSAALFHVASVNCDCSSCSVSCSVALLILFSAF